MAWIAFCFFLLRLYAIRSFVLGAIASVCPYLLPFFVGSLKTHFPELELMISEGLTDDLVNALRQGKLDAVIAATTFERAGLEEIPLFFEPFLLASRKLEPLPSDREALQPQSFDPAMATVSR